MAQRFFLVIFQTSTGWCLNNLALVMVNHAHPCAYLEIRQCIPAHHYQVGPMVQPDYLRAAKQALRLVPIELVFRSNAAHMWWETMKKKKQCRKICHTFQVAGLVIYPNREGSSLQQDLRFKLFHPFFLWSKAICEKCWLSIMALRFFLEWFSKLRRVDAWITSCSRW